MLQRKKRGKDLLSLNAKIFRVDDKDKGNINHVEDIRNKLDLILLTISVLVLMMETLNQTDKCLLRKVSSLEVDVTSVKDKEKTSDMKFTHIKNHSNYKV